MTVLVAVVLAAVVLVAGATFALGARTATDDAVAGTAPPMTGAAPAPVPPAPTAPAAAAESPAPSEAPAPADGPGTWAPTSGALPDGPVDYVALGDSFTSGLGLAVQRADAPGCGRSTRGYPSLLASALGVAALTDASCAGAPTAAFDARQQTGVTTVPPQRRALADDTDLVTVGLGANDFDLVGKIVGTCVRVQTLDPTGSPCRDAYEDGAASEDLVEVAAVAGGRVAGVLDGIRRTSPDAAVVVVGYPGLTTGQTCAALGFTEADARWATEVFTALDDAMAAAAREAGAGFLDTGALVAPHDVCSADPWVAGFQPTTANPVAWHPGAAYARAVAGALAEVVGRSPASAG